MFNKIFTGNTFFGTAFLALFASEALATNGAPAAPGPAGDPLASMILPIGLIVLFYFFLIRPQSKRHKQHKEMVAALQKGIADRKAAAAAGSTVQLRERVGVSSGCQLPAKSRPTASTKCCLSPIPALLMRISILSSFAICSTITVDTSGGFAASTVLLQSNQRWP